MVRTVRSLAFRIALMFAVAVTLTTTLVSGLVYWRFYESNEAIVRAVLENEVGQVIDAPSEVLRRRLELRLTQDLRHLDYVGLYDAAGVRTFGNSAASLPIAPDGRAHLLRAPPPQPDSSQNENALFVAGRRPGGGTLVLGRSLVYVDELAAAMLRGFATALAPVVVLALIIGAIVGRRALHRLSGIQRAIGRVMAGELHVRLPARGTTDDIDALVGAVNLMLDEIGRLVGQIKSVGDNIAHDLRAPLAVMRARLERGLAGASDVELRRLTVEALGDLDRAMTTVTALLRISELESGVRRGAFSPVDLAAIGRDAFELFAPLAEAKGVAMSLDAPSPVIVAGDGDLLCEALANLIDNAIKFTPPGGRVTVECRGEAGALLRVIDSGPGIRPDERAKIFKRFYRSEATKQAAGVGLGLSMAATIIDLHGFGLRIRDAAPGAILEILSDPDRSDAAANALP